MLKSPSITIHCFHLKLPRFSFSSSSRLELQLSHPIRNQLQEQIGKSRHQLQLCSVPCRTNHICHLKMIQTFYFRKLGDIGNFSLRSPQPPMKIRRTNTNVNNRNLDHDHSHVSFQFQGKIAKISSTGLEGILCFVYCDVNR